MSFFRNFRSGTCRVPPGIGSVDLMEGTCRTHLKIKVCPSLEVTLCPADDLFHMHYGLISAYPPELLPASIALTSLAVIPSTIEDYHNGPQSMHWDSP